ncbi:single-stranded DNA-binding protein [uncultured Peptoniphilus sp.]|uniref:single-stranded DNA-binding protein n=1 Tax=uncultured Peptoniphilus sp. TaxID=254354 RepID=UPI002805110D|nr:single-stranded DNA-binding protein [uncultured Peptoniphilus sp.]
MNSCNLIGRLVREPELRYTAQGTAVVRFTVACNRSLSKERKAEAEAAGQPTADFISCTAWKGQAELIANYFHKGDQIGIEGRIQTGSYEKNGAKVYTTDVLVGGITFVGSNNERYSSTNNQTQENGFYPTDNDDIPF